MTFIVDGTNGLTFNNSTTQASAGVVLQVVNATYSTIASNSTTTYADTGLTATITPKFSTSKILILVSQNGVYASSTNTGVGLAILRGTSLNICQFSKLEGFGSATILSSSASYLDSPATTSATTYKTQFALGQNTGTVSVQNNGDTSTIVLMEIAG
jgi:hypothetical protein